MGQSTPGANEPTLLDKQVVHAIAARGGVTPAQVLIRWSIERGLSVTPKSINPERRRQNLEAAEISLTAEDMQALARLDRGSRYLSGAVWLMPVSPYRAADLWGE